MQGARRDEGVQHLDELLLALVEGPGGGEATGILAGVAVA